MVQAPATIPLAELQRRAEIMFSGKTGAVVASGDQGVTSEPSFQLVDDVINVIKILDERTPALFDRHSQHRPCGLLCKYSAAGMLVGDVVGLPLMPWTLAEKIGKQGAKLQGEIPGEKSKAKKKAKRKGRCVEEATAAVLQRAAKLPLPTPAAIAAAWREIGTAASVSMAPEEPVPALTPEPVPAPATPAPEPRVPRWHVPERIVHAALSDAGQRVILTAWAVESYRRAISEGDDASSQLRVAQALYEHMLKEFRQAYPGKFDKSKWSEPRMMMDLSVKLVAQGVRVLAAEKGAEMVKIDLGAIAAHCRAMHESE